MGGRRGSNQPPSVPAGRWPEIIERHKCGEPVKDLANEFGITDGYMSRMLQDRGVTSADREVGAIRDKNLRKFASAVRSLLWQEESGEDETHPLYFAWKDRVDEYRKQHRLSYGAAIVQATKEQRKCWKLFLRYDVEEFDRFPDSHPAATQYKHQRLLDSVAKGKMKSEGIEQNHKQNLSWAIAAAGEFSRTGVEPASCPNDAAYFLYEQAKSSPETFLARFTSIESKTGNKDEPDRLTSERAIGEIDGFLKTLADDTDE